MGRGILEGDGLSSAVQLDPEGALLLMFPQRVLNNLQVALATGLYLQ
jgi:hypothetical protein